MRVLFITWETYPIKSATSNCIMNIISELKKDQIEADVVNITGDIFLPKEIIYNNIHFYNLFFSRYTSLKMLLKKNIIVAGKEIIERMVLRFAKNRDSYISKKTIKSVVKKLQKLGQAYDVFIAVCSHVMNGIICEEYCKKNNKKYIIYQVDPIGSNLVYSSYSNVKNIELSMYKHASSILTTPILAKEKENDPDYSDLLYKVFATEFPNVKDLTLAHNKRNIDNSIVCFYSGRFYNGVRDCTYPLTVFSSIQNLDYDLVFAGDGQETIINEFKNKYFGKRLKHLGMISMTESFKMMQEADVLINIGNNVTNQVPSKLFDYISTGKPIVNFCKNKNCPTIPYINKYRLGISIIEGEDTLSKQALIVSNFIKDHYKERIEFDEIKTVFSNNTSEYVGRIFIKLLKEI